MCVCVCVCVCVHMCGYMCVGCIEFVLVSDPECHKLLCKGFSETQKLHVQTARLRLPTCSCKGEGQHVVVKVRAQHVVVKVSSNM